MDSTEVRKVYEFKITEQEYVAKFNTYLQIMGLEKQKTESFIYLARKYSLHSYRGSGTGILYVPEGNGLSGKTCVTIGELLLKNTSLIDSTQDFGLLKALRRLKLAKDGISEYLDVWIPFNDKMIKYDAKKLSKSGLTYYNELKNEEQKVELIAKKYSKEIAEYESIIKEIDKIVSKIELTYVSSKMLSPMYYHGELLDFGSWRGGDTVNSLEYGYKW